MPKRPPPGSNEQQRESALGHRIIACEIRAALRRMTGNEKSAWTLAARTHEGLVRDYTRGLRARGAARD